MNKRYIGIKELSEYLSFSVGTLYTWTCYKKIPYHKVGGGLRFDLQEIDKWMAKKKQKVLL